MDFLPSDPHILVSSINMMLRDGDFDTLADLCASFGKDFVELNYQIEEAGYYYDEEQRQIKAK